jgi:hypothetical protein
VFCAREFPEVAQSEIQIVADSVFLQLLQCFVLMLDRAGIGSVMA